MKDILSASSGPGRQREVTKLVVRVDCGRSEATVAAGYLPLSWLSSTKAAE